MRSFMSCIAMVLASVASVPANAQVAVVDLTAGDDTNVEYAPALAVPPEVAATTSLDFDGATAYGYANASTGILRGYATPATGISGFAYSSDTIEDSVLFSAGVGEAAAITYHWDGDLDPYSGQLYIAEATLGIGIYYADGTSLTQNYDLEATSCFTGVHSTDICTIGTSIDETRSLPFVIKPGYTTIGLSLFLTAADGQSVNFSDTAAFNLVLPAGVSYASSSGEFLETAAPLSSVPESSTLTLLLVGVSTCFGVHRRILKGRRATQVPV
jgi:hypothetical protein